MTEIMECDVAIIGAGPAGLSAAIRLMQLNSALNVMVLEKGSEVGAHILSGAVLEPRALNELLPNWKELGAPLNTPAKEDHSWFLTEKKHYKLPTPPQMHNSGNYIISLGNFVRWLGAQAEALGVQIFAGFPAAEAIIEDGIVKGIRTGAFGISKNGEQKDSYQEPMEIRAKYTLFAEGCRGSLSEQLMQAFNLREGVQPQTYGIGIKELWEIPSEKHSQGNITHTIGWPMDMQTYGGSFIYHLENNQLAIGYVIGLDYQNPYLDPYMEFQRFKMHPAIRPLLEGGRRISYGARALNEGGWQSIPKLTMNGGALIGCAAGFLNVPKIKGTHTAMKSGMAAAEAIATALQQNRAHDEVTDYSTNIRNSWVGEELKAVRNIRPAFRFGLWAGLAISALETLTRGKLPYTLGHHEDYKQTKLAAECTPIHYPKPDGVVSFDRLSSVFISNTNHEEDQPAHLKLKDAEVSISGDYAQYAGTAARFCPAGVYEYLEESGKPRLQINAQNCVHCKTCDIKEPMANIRWTTPEGGGGPNYPNM
jgi:electron-transferring-flavoprotein dehydrogenase